MLNLMTLVCNLNPPGMFAARYRGEAFAITGIMRSCPNTQMLRPYGFKILNLNPANKAKPCCRNRIEMVGFPRYSAVY
ncbi:hypothetical protein KsCSTR_03470 [Candidatus Kuenenia stuttgartiensis]|uniref:Uncharacterized protein n=1 Tax=Kuenenia stuttgartiensis TaxID=174633 RepID=A0A6G7GJJ7_KUEST|nr:hypothetical protein KsCSTR_03470 [Candidatus Kuenenia stuttgartiensis]